MHKAVSNTSPLLYLYRIDALKWLPSLFAEIWIPGAVVLELQEGLQKGYDVPKPTEYDWIKIVEPKIVPSEWFAIDLGAGEIAAMSIALDYPDMIILLDDALARRTAMAAGLNVWGTLRILLETKSSGLIENVKPLIYSLEDAGLWVSEGIRQRILKLAGEK